VAIVERIITVYNDKGSKQAVKDLVGLEKKFANAGKKIAKAFAVATVAVGAFAVKVGIDSVKAAIADEKAQTLLANSLRNTTGATDAAIAATETYIDQIQRTFGVVDDELRPALAKLASVTGSITDAQKLLGLALDVSAGGGIDLGAATNAVTKALQGNYKALKNLGVPITDAMVKSKDLNAILQLTAKTFAGAAAARANTFEFRMTRLTIALDEAKETLGAALLPTLEELFKVLTTKVIPAVQQFLEENGNKLVAAFEMAIKAIVGFGFAVFKVFQFVAKNKNVFITLGAILAATFVAGKVIAFVTAIGKLVAIYKTLRSVSIAAAAAQAVATGGISVAAGVAGLAAFTATLGGLYVAVKGANSAMDGLDETSEDLDFSFDGLNDKTGDFLTNLKGLNVDLGKTTTKTKAQTAADKAAAQAKTVLAALAKLGVKPTTEKDPIQLEAARLNLLKQNNLEEQRRLAAIMENMKAQLLANQAIERYSDLLGVVADQKISNEEVALLAGKWGISKEAVVVYTTAVFAVNDAKLSTAEIDLLATQWGVTKQQAEMYLDFFKAVNDGKLDQTEINGLMDKWKLTSKEVNDYAKKISEGVTPSTLWPTPGNQAAESWKAALAALNAYLAATGAKVTPTAPTAPTKPVVPVVPVVPTVPGADDAAPVFTIPKNTKDFTATNPVIAKLVEDINFASESVTDQFFKALVDGADLPSAVRGANYQARAEAEYAASLAKISLTDPMAQASLQSGLAGGASLSAALSGSRYAAQAAAQYGSGTTVNVTVQGSVTSENDLVASIRNGLLQGQNNGQQIVKSATAL
jgi:hypothetical protein